MLPKTRGAFHFSIPDPQHIRKSRGSPYRSNVCTQTTDRSTRRKDAELYLLSVITQVSKLSIPTADFQQLLLRTRISSPSPLPFFLRTRFSRDLARGLPRSRRCGRTGGVERMWIAIGSHFTFPELGGRRAKAKGVWRAAPGANMPRYAQLVMGPAGSGKSTYCATMVQHCEALNRSVQVVNLDPAAEHFNYSVMADIRELIEVDDVMEDDSLRFGPNGGLVFCMEYFANNFDWLENCLGHVEDDYILFDCPGQIELYTHLPVMKQLVQQLEQWEFRVCGVFLVDSQFMVESFKIDDYSMVRFLPYDQSDEESMNIVLQHIDFAIQYGEDLEFKEPKEREDESSSMFDEYFQECQDE
ncbi:GPN-loop GTPase 3 isoform X2 [Pan paniscus]|uniref:GPN-loop GTPase 3 isoform X2 n=1 Tax=Pan paniscus TaxID=9597 RepID=UPI0024362CE3|nr:GPN-loop GTPase 3 isoform X2 [Pan paniscus]